MKTIREKNENGTGANEIVSKPLLPVYHSRKWLVDRFFALVLLVPGIPLILLLGILVKLTSKGPVIYSQVRVGKDGKNYTMYKIRTMVQDAEVNTGPVWAIKKDPRITFVGKVLRKLHLDEIPQLWNVLRGDMALVGPRPERPEFVEILEQKIPGYKMRLYVVPGVTGYSQLNLSADRDLNDVRRKLALDMEYIENASFWFDLRLLFGTGCRVFKYAHRTPLEFLGIYQTAPNSPWADYYGVPDENDAQTGAALDAIFAQAPTTPKVTVQHLKQSV